MATTALLLLGLTVLPTPAQAREPLDVRLFARVPDPGQPEGIAVDSSGTVYVGTSPKEGGPAGAGRRSKIFAYNARGELVREYLIRGQDVDDPFYGLVGMAFDGHDHLYATDAAPARIVRLDVRTGRQTTYATFVDVTPCQPPSTRGNCSATSLDMAPFPDYPVFAPGGAMYVTDLNQALIWRVPPGGGKAKVWFTDPGLETLFGPNGIQFEEDGRTLLFVLSTFSNPFAPTVRTPGLYELPVRADGRPGKLRQLWEAGHADVPDGFALGRSGKAYVALAGTTGNAVAVISPDGEELARTPANEVENQRMEVPFDQPASVAFLGRRLLVTNHSLFARNPDHYAVLDVFTGERGLPLYRPLLDATVQRRRMRVAVRPQGAVVGRRTCFRFRVRDAATARPLSGTRIGFMGKRRRSNGRGRAVVCHRFRRARVGVARVSRRGYLPIRLRVRIRARD